MKYLVVLLVVGVVVWMLMARRRSRPKGGGQAPTGHPGEPVSMLACAHCGLLLPPDEALRDAGGQVFCSEAHRLAGRS